jgi:hypothetical protein
MRTAYLCCGVNVGAPADWGGFEVRMYRGVGEQDDLVCPI